MKKKEIAKFRMILELPLDVAKFENWTSIKGKLEKMFKENLGGVQPIIESEIPKHKKLKGYDYIVNRY